MYRWEVFVMEESLPEDVECGVIQIFGCKTGRINDGEAGVLAVNDMLFDQFHTRHVHV